jgi:ATP-dependent Clp endopeptidase proteolytic subunit ClpP
MKVKRKIFQKNKPRLDETEEEGEEAGSEETTILMPSMDDPNVRIVGLYGAIEEEKCAAVISMLYHMRETGREVVPVEESETDETSETKSDEIEVNVFYQPIEFIISTEGGSAADMFAVYDVMNDVGKECEIATFGVGRVMSAGVLLMAAGTKGKRRIGRNCRLMIHNVSSGNYGAIHDQENNIKETKWFQERYIKCLSENSNMTEKQIKTIFRKKLDFFFDAEAAVKFGIADIIV